MYSLPVLSPAILDSEKAFISFFEERDPKDVSSIFTYGFKGPNRLRIVRRFLGTKNVAELSILCNDEKKGYTIFAVVGTEDKKLIISTDRQSCLTNNSGRDRILKEFVFSQEPISPICNLIKEMIAGRLACELGMGSREFIERLSSPLIIMAPKIAERPQAAAELS